MQSWLLFRKRRSQSSRRPPCGKDCGATAGEALCIGKADPYCVVEIVNDEGLSYRLGRTPVIPHDHYPKWRKEFSTILDIESNARLLIKVLDSDMNESTNVDVLGQASFPLRDIIMSPPKAIRLSLSIKHPGMRIPRSVGAPRRHTIHGASSSVQRGSRRTLRATIGGGSTLGPGSGGPGSGGPGSQQVGSEGPGSQQVGSLTAGSLRTGLGAGGLGGGSSEFEDSEAAPRPAGYCSSFNSSFRNSDSGGAGGKSGSCMSRVKVEFRWYDMSKDLHTTDLNVPQTYFRRSHGNLVRLYHDAECLEGQFEDIETELGPFHAHSTWNDISEALENAQHFIFVAGWSVNPSISLTRSHKPVERSPLGRKAASAVERNGGGERSGGVDRSGERSRQKSGEKSGEKSDKARMDKAGMTKPG
ncbi:phospholipase D, partial [Gregarina niphandrodes]